MKNKKLQNAIIVFVIIFICGLLIVINSFNLGTPFSRQYDNSGWSLSDYEVNIKAISFMVVGALLSLISGLGLVLLTIKNIFDV
ncbi:hypothetical protein [Clostridium saccharoperbutylacetonicum]|uniref:hypothetical protein n=1 Tax=Clostridium saccharoperbutylacetonicum TaxID=36745 RepID=UPI000983FB77|nr:hypothetical protein [Clostridium saccharoperbutylacetonicum]AQR94340.1 hypothetical protein CLSAP_16470 [Clostridium saccharoperbutylacetonicum]NSB30039.1 hypothetical protein [Clostridium saccharoperbutylacetonicum]